jgi:DHA1 family multidrug resistance protein-like MFS transporter
VAACAPRERMGFAMGMLQVGLWAGIALGPLIGGPLADAFGFTVPFVVTAVMLGLAGILVWFGVDEKFDPKQQRVGKRVGFVTGWRHVLSMPGVPLTYSLRFLNALSRTMLTPIMPLFIQSLMPTSIGVGTFTGVIVGAASATVTASAVYLGRLGDRLGHRRIIIFSAMITALLYIPQAFVTEAWQLIVLQMMTGAAAGGLISSPSALLARYTVPGEEGNVYGIDSTVVSGARALSPLLGATIAVAFGYRGVFTFTGLILLAVFFLALRWLPQTSPEPQLKTI